MSKFNTLNVEHVLSPFATAIGESFPKIVGDVKSMLGRIEKDIITKHGGWKASAAGSKLTSKDGYTVALPLNNPAAQLLAFGMRLQDMAEAGKFDIVASVPSNCQHWIDEHKNAPVIETIPA